MRKRRVEVRPESMKGLRRSKGSDGTVLPGLWEHEFVRMELFDDGWRCETPMRRIGETFFYEHRPLDMGGRWVRIGSYGTRAACCIVAERLKDGTHVYQTGYMTGEGQVQSGVVPWAEVRDQIAAHPSVSGK